MSFYITSAIKSYFISYQGLQRACWKGIALSFIESTLAGVYYFLSIYFVDVLLMPLSLAGMIISCYGLGTILGGLIGGYLSDKFSPFLVLTASLSVQALAFLCLIYLKNPGLIAVDLFILGIATYGFITSNYVWVLAFCQYSESEKLKAINMLSIASNLGIGLSAILIGEMSQYGFYSIFYLSGIFLLLLAVSLCFQFKSAAKSNNNSLKPNTINDTKELSSSINLKKIKPIHLVLVCLLFTGMIVSQLSTTYSIYLKEIFPEQGIKAFTFLFTLNTCLVVFFQNYLVSWLGSKNKLMMIGIGSFLIGLGMLVLNFSTIFLIAIFSCIIYSAGEMLFFSMTQLYCYQKATAGKKGRGLGMYRTIYASSRFLGPTIGATIYQYLGGSTLWYISGIVGLIFLLLCYFLRNVD